MSQPENTKPKGPKNTKYMLVRYGRLGMMGWFEHNESHIPKLSSKVIVKTERGLELGESVGVHNYRGGQFRSTPEQVEAYYGTPGPNSPVGQGGTFMRFATHEDIREQEHLIKSEKEEIECCEKYIKEFGLPMRIVEAEHLFGGERIVYYFTSECRVDFRDLVKTLAREYQTRIELRQIGARDEAKLVSDYETCGQQCCCSRFLKILEPVNMRMAKLQKATLDPSKISGHCGRLKCCLRYEDQTYMEMKDKLPHRNATVRTPKGVGKVVDVQILTQLVVVQDSLGDRTAWPVDELLPLDGKGAQEQDIKSQPVNPSRASRSSPVETVMTEEVEDEAIQEQDAAMATADQSACGQCPACPAEGRVERNASDRRPKQNNRSNRLQNNAARESSPTQQRPGEGGQRNKNRRKKRRGKKPGGGQNQNRPGNSGNTNATPSGE